MKTIATGALLLTLAAGNVGCTGSEEDSSTASGSAATAEDATARLRTERCAVALAWEKHASYQIDFGPEVDRALPDAARVEARDVDSPHGTPDATFRWRAADVGTLFVLEFRDYARRDDPDAWVARSFYDAREGKVLKSTRRPDGTSAWSMRADTRTSAWRELRCEDR